MSNPKEEKIVVTFYIPKSIHFKLKVFAVKKAKSMSKIIKEILIKFFEENV